MHGPHPPHLSGIPIQLLSPSSCQNKAEVGEMAGTAQQGHKGELGQKGLLGNNVLVLSPPTQHRVCMVGSGSRGGCTESNTRQIPRGTPCTRGAYV